MHSKLRLRLGLLLIVGLLLFLSAASLRAQSAPPPLPTRPLPTATPTPSPAPTITPSPSPTATGAPSQPAAPETTQGSVIVLEAQSAMDLAWGALWTVVEQQTEDGAWRSVEGWQGAFDSVDDGAGYKTWDVPPSLFGQGPFRWRVDAGRDGQTLATSQPFTLPERAGVRLVVIVTLPATSQQPILLPATGVSVGWLSVLVLLVSVVIVWRIVHLECTSDNFLG